MGFLAVAVLLHWFAMPDVILNDHSGGSCYQGLTRGINRFLFELCLFFALISYFMAMWKKRSLSIFTAVIPAFIWTLWSFALTREYALYGFLYATPFLLYIALYLYHLIKNKEL